MPLVAVGKDVDSWCTRCKLMLAHTVEAQANGKISRVHCNTCRSQHAYRSAPPGTRSVKPGAAATRARKPAVGTVRRVRSYHELVKGRDAAAAQPYAPGAVFKQSDLINHPVFGLGVVTISRGEMKIEVTFADKVRTLVHAG